MGPAGGALLLEQNAIAAVFLLALTAAIVSDLVSFRIPNAIPLCLAGLFLVDAFRQGIAVSSLALHLTTGVTLLVAGAALYYTGVVGGGDAKLLAAIALWSGWYELPRLLIVMALAGGVLSLGLLLARRLRIGAPNGPFARLLAAGGPVPYGVAIAAGGFDLWFRHLILTQLR
jgi:prepilin peptidase CpaA